MSQITRRRLLTTAGVATMAGVAGCLGSGSDDTPSSSNGTELGELTVENLSREDHTVDVLVEFDGDIEHWTTHDLDDDNAGVELDQEWPESPGSLRVLARLDGDEIIQATPDQWNDPPCLNLTIVIRRDGTLRMLSDTSSGSCASTDDDGDDE